MLFTIITIINEWDVYEGFKRTLEAQDFSDYEIKVIDNCNNEFKSAREVYGNVALEAKGEYLLFVHPDIRFVSNNDLMNVVSWVKKIGDFGVVGVAGTPEEICNGNRVILSNIIHGENKIRVGKKIEKEYEVQTVDECFFIVKRSEIYKVPFSNKGGWHLYAVELCLQFVKNGKKNYVIPIELWHLSDGKSLDYKYVLQMWQLIKEYKNDVKIINTTVKMWRTQGLYSSVYVLGYLIKQCVKGIMKRCRILN